MGHVLISVKPPIWEFIISFPLFLYMINIFTIIKWAFLSFKCYKHAEVVAKLSEFKLSEFKYWLATQQLGDLGQQALLRLNE